jgi:hypothetical protein
VPLFDFPDVALHSEEMTVKRHPQFTAAKGGDIVAADTLVADLASAACMDGILERLRGQTAELVPVHALETEGVNEIPAALAKLISRQLRLAINESIVQCNSVGHTGAGGYHRLAHQAQFVGEVTAGARYFLVDDFVGQGGTIANLAGFIESRGGFVLGATVLTGRAYSVKLAPDRESIRALRSRHGQDLEDWWQHCVGFGFDCLTRSEARYLENSPDAQTIRDRLVEAGLESGADRDRPG